jgi:glycosyltransferase involved in cell wall biosynthesis
MRIALVVHKFPPSSLGGTEVYTQNLARELVRRGHQVAVFFRAEPPGAWAPGQEWEDREGFRALRVWRGFDMATASPIAKYRDTFYNPDLDARFASFLGEVKPDLVHFQHVMWLSYRMIHAVRARQLPSLLTLHDYWFLCANSQLVWPDHRTCQGKLAGLNCARCALAQTRLPGSTFLRPLVAPAFWIRDALIRSAAFAADHWVAPSQFLISRYVQAGFPAERFTYLENGVDLKAIGTDARPPCPAGPLRFTYLGSLAWQKGVDVVVKAMRGIPPSQASLTVYGDPSTFPDYAQSIAESADPTNTEIGGILPRDAVGQALAQTDVLVVPSLWYENSPLVIQEAFAAGVPVVASDIGALAEKVRPGVDGWLCAPGDIKAWHENLQRLAEHPDEVARVRSGVRPPLTLQEHVTRLEELYAQY